MNWNLLLITLPVGVTLNLFYDEGLPKLAHLTARFAARLSYQNYPVRADVWMEEISALIDERPGSISKMATALGFLIRSVSYSLTKAAAPLKRAAEPSALGALALKRPRIRWLAALLLLLLAATAITTNLAIGARESAFWWTISAAFAVLSLGVLAATSLSGQTSQASVIATLATRVEQELRDLNLQSFAPINIPFRLSAPSDKLHLSPDDIFTGRGGQKRVAIIGPPGSGKTSLL